MPPRSGTSTWCWALLLAARCHHLVAGYSDGSLLLIHARLYSDSDISKTTPGDIVEFNPITREQSSSTSMSTLGGQCTLAFGNGGSTNFDMIGTPVMAMNGTAVVFTCINANAGVQITGGGSGGFRFPRLTGSSSDASTFASNAGSQFYMVTYPIDSSTFLIGATQDSRFPVQIGPFGQSFNTAGGASQKVFQTNAAVRHITHASSSSLTLFSFSTPGFGGVYGAGIYTFSVSRSGSTYTPIGGMLPTLLIGFPTGSQPYGYVHTSSTTIHAIDIGRSSSGGASLFRYDLTGTWMQTDSIIINARYSVYSIASTGVYNRPGTPLMFYLATPHTLHSFNPVTRAVADLAVFNTDVRCRGVSMVPLAFPAISPTPAPSSSMAASPAVSFSAVPSTGYTAALPADSIFLVSVEAYLSTAPAAGGSFPVSLTGLTNIGTSPTILNNMNAVTVASNCALPGAVASVYTPAVSADGAWLVLPCYATTPATSVSPSIAANIKRAVARVALNGAAPNADVTTQLPASNYVNTHFTAAVTYSGTDFWLASGLEGATGNNDGVRFARFGATTGTRISAPSISGVTRGDGIMTLQVFNGTLFGLSVQMGFNGIMRLGNVGALPVSSSQPEMLLNLDRANHAGFPLPTACTSFVLQSFSRAFLSCSPYLFNTLHRYVFDAALAVWKRDTSWGTGDNVRAASMTGRREASGDYMLYFVSITASSSSLQRLNTDTGDLITVYTQSNKATRIIVGVAALGSSVAATVPIGSSATSTPSPSPSLTASPSASASQTSTVSASRSASASSSPSMAATSSPSASMTRSSSRTASSSASVTRSPSITASSSVSMTRSQTLSAPLSQTPSRTPSMTASPAQVSLMLQLPSTCANGAFRFGYAANRASVLQQLSAVAANGTLWPACAPAATVLVSSTFKPIGSAKALDTALQADPQLLSDISNVTCHRPTWSAVTLLYPALNSSAGTAMRARVPVGQAAGDVCVVSCNGSISSTNVWGPFVYMCDTDGSWKAAAARFASRPLSTAEFQVAANASIACSVPSTPLLSYTTATAAYFADDRVFVYPLCSVTTAGSVVSSPAVTVFPVVPAITQALRAPQPQCASLLPRAATVSSVSVCDASATATWTPAPARSWRSAVSTAASWAPEDAAANAQIVALATLAADNTPRYHVALTVGVRNVPASALAVCAAAAGVSLLSSSVVQATLLTSALTAPAVGAARVALNWTDAASALVARVRTSPAALVTPTGMTTFCGAPVDVSITIVNAGILSNVSTVSLVTDGIASTPFVLASSMLPPQPAFSSTVTASCVNIVARPLMPLRALPALTAAPRYTVPIAPFSAAPFVEVARLVIGDALPLALLRVELPYPPSTGETLAVTCSADAPAVTITRLDSQRTISTTSWSAASPTSNGALFSFSLRLQPEGNSLSPATVATATCNITRSSAGARPLYAPLTTVTTELLILRARWPLFSDAVLEMHDAGLKSAWATAPQALNSLAAAAQVNISSIEDANAVDDAAAVIALAARSPAGARRPLQVTVTGARNITLVGDVLQRMRAGPYFTSSTKVYVGAAAATIRWVSSDGSLMRITTPPASAVCSSGDCGQQPIVIVSDGDSPLSVPALAAAEALQLLPLDAASVRASSDDCGGVATLDATVSATRIATTMSCPPFCAGVDGARPVAVASNAFTWRGNPYSNISLQYASGVASTTAGGVYYTLECTAGGFTDPSTGACLNASDPASARCAYGAGDACVPCPRGALCPGGWRVLPLPGYWNTGITSNVVIRCQPPSDRCQGFNISLGDNVCGVGYRQGSVGCGSCDASFYRALDGTCRACPADVGPLAVFLPILQFIAGLAGVAVVMLLIVYLITKRAGGTFAGGAVRTLKFIISIIAVLQVLVQVGKAAAPGLPPLLQQFYATLAVLQLEGITIPPACITNAAKYASQETQLCVVFALTCLLALMFVDFKRCYRARRISAEDKQGDADVTQNCFTRVTVSICARADAAKPVARRVIFTILTLLYAMVANTTLLMVNCTSITTTVRTYLQMDQDGATLQRVSVSLPPPDDIALCADDTVSPECAATYALLSQSLSVRVLVQDTFQVCMEGSHRNVGVLAWMALVVYVIMYPLLSLLIIRHRVRMIMSRGELRKQFMQSAAIDAARQRAFINGTPSRVLRFCRILGVKLCCVGTRYSELRRRMSGAGLRATTRKAVRCCTHLVSCATHKYASSGVDRERRLLNMNDLVDACEAVNTDATAAYWTSSDFRASMFFFRHIDMLLLATLSAVLIFWATPADLASASSKCTVTVFAVLTVAGLYFVRSPYRPELQWAQVVRIYCLLLAAFAAIVNVVAFADTWNAPSDDSSSGNSLKLLVLAYMSFAASVGLGVTLLVTFFLSLWTGARQEASNVLIHAPTLGVKRHSINSMEWRESPLAGRERSATKMSGLKAVTQVVASGETKWATAAASRVQHAATAVHATSHEALTLVSNPAHATEKQQQHVLAVGGYANSRVRAAPAVSRAASRPLPMHAVRDDSVWDQDDEGDTVSLTSHAASPGTTSGPHVNCADTRPRMNVNELRGAAEISRATSFR